MYHIDVVDHDAPLQTYIIRRSYSDFEDLHSQLTEITDRPTTAARRCPDWPGASLPYPPTPGRRRTSSSAPSRRSRCCQRFDSASESRPDLELKVDTYGDFHTKVEYEINF
ncbi:hypothetical protein PF005_g32316 [Phytophthora fragariae]|uniref:PX domain-containing protein n=1 Tax=Phytophthora fragariae TaxID=53985 RepID=A0A6A3VIG9_9STRA|nr:hypothetical protein PF003_g20347 [Phytophthora fragariae]KAE9056709.1 hypothetical protein PF010_g31661 [Phytophthora fragariae]KAE9158761.1 hypothetical protein PF005_g32316 [Phytophthora fragariae]KAE9168008.1 hypothetical protein PF002_g30724 [Phytophthora fragariae]